MVNLSILSPESLLVVLPAADVYEVPGNSGRGSHGWAYQVRPPAGALAAFKVPVAGGGAALAGLKAIRVHAQAHGASGFAPLKAGVGKDAVQSFLLGRVFYLLRSRHHHGLNAF